MHPKVVVVNMLLLVTSTLIWCKRGVKYSLLDCRIILKHSKTYVQIHIYNLCVWALAYARVQTQVYVYMYLYRPAVQVCDSVCACVCRKFSICSILFLPSVYYDFVVKKMRQHLAVFTLRSLERKHSDPKKFLWKPRYISIDFYFKSNWRDFLWV